MAIQRMICGHCDHDEWLSRCDGCTVLIGSEDVRLKLSSFYGDNLPLELQQRMQGRQLVLCGGCATGGVDLLQLLATYAAEYPELTR